MKFESLHRTFNRQVDLIDAGNVVGNAQFSGYVRPRSEVIMPDGVTPCARGCLQEWDLNSWHRDLPSHIREWVRTNPYCENNSIILYELRHWIGSGSSRRKVVHGYIATTGDSAGYLLLNTWIARPGCKSESVIEEAVKYLTNECEPLKQAA
jgi:hypothetical protein